MLIPKTFILESLKNYKRASNESKVEAYKYTPSFYS